MKKYSVWKDEEVKNLFNLVETYKHNNESLLFAFSKYANQTNRKRNSVRNYYYAELKELKNNKERREHLKIDISKHIITSPKNFSEKEIEKFVFEILKLNAKGYSIRKACLILSKNNITEMVRFQNKYRNLLNTNKELIEKCIKKLKNDNIFVKNPLKIDDNETITKNNIISMPISKQSKLSDSEITSLFLGLVKLVKKCAKEEAEFSFKQELQETNNNLRKSTVKISGLEIENKKLSEKILNTTTENQKLNNELILLKSEVASLIQNKLENKIISDKYNKLSNYVKTFKKKQEESLKASKE